MPLITQNIPNYAEELEAELRKAQEKRQLPSRRNDPQEDTENIETQREEENFFESGNEEEETQDQDNF